jgi:hypothetical protein
MTISIQVECTCGRTERREFHDDESVPEKCRRCEGCEAPLTQNHEHNNDTDTWDPLVKRLKTPRY